MIFFSVWLLPACDEDLARAIRPKHDVPYQNSHYTPGCGSVRYGVLLGLTPRECDLGRRIVFAISCGGAVGYERRRVDRPAGIRTMALVALGACVFTITSIFAFEDGPMTWDSRARGARTGASSVLQLERFAIARVSRDARPLFERPRREMITPRWDP